MRKPEIAGFYLNRGNLMLDWQHYEAAAADYLKAIELNPKSADAYRCLGHSLASLKQLEHSIASYDQAMALDPGQKYLIGTRRAAKMLACDWDGSTEDLAAITEGVNAGRLVCNPLVLAQLVDSPSLHRAAAESWIRKNPQPMPRSAPLDLEHRRPRSGSGIFPQTFAAIPWRT